MVSVTTHISFSEASDEDLFVYIACSETNEDTVIANKAFEELHRRYSVSLYRTVLRSCAKFPDSETLAGEITSATLYRAYKKADTYRVNNDKKGALGWLAVISRNMLRDWIRNPDRPGPLSVVELDVDTSIYSAEDFVSFFVPQNGLVNTHENCTLIAEAFEMLDERTQEVLLVTCLQRERSPKKTHMLRGSGKLLAERLGTSSDNVRKIRKEGIQAINKYLAMNKSGSGGRDEKA